MGGGSHGDGDNDNNDNDNNDDNNDKDNNTTKLVKDRMQSVLLALTLLGWGWLGGLFW